MERAALLWTLALCAGFITWLVMDIKNSGIDYSIHQFLIDQRSGRARAPSELMDMPKILNLSRAYVEGSSAMERLHDLVFNLNLENPTYIDQMYSNDEQLRVSGWPVADSGRCRQQLEAILAQLARLGSDYALERGQLGLELAQLVGSIGKPEAGTLSAGLVTWLGSYERCQRLSVSSLGGPSFGTRFCWARFRPKWWPRNETIYPPAVIRVGSCLPESCDTRAAELHAHQISQLVKFEWPRFWAQNLEFESIFCLPDERSPMRQLPRAAFFFLYALCAWLALVLTASLLYEIKRHRERQAAKGAQAEKPLASEKPQQLSDSGRNGATLQQHSDQQNSNDEASNQQSKITQQVPIREQLIEALAIHCSIKSFKTHRFRFKYSQARGSRAHARPRVDLSCFDCFKILMALFIVLGHGAYLGTLYSRSLANRLDMNTGLFGPLTLCIGRFVDTFFVFFGVLTTYNLMRKVHESQLGSPLVWLAMNLGVFLRVAPVFMLVYCYARLIGPYTGAGPWWDYGVKRHTMRQMCLDEPWWKALPYLGTLGSPSISPCVLPAWFIVSYSQISLLLPLITYVVARLPSNLARLALMLFLASISALQLAFRLGQQTTIEGDSFVLYGGFILNLLEKFESSGQMSALGRVGCVSIGCYVGYLLRQYELGHIRRWPRWLERRLVFGLAIALSFLLGFLPLIGFYLSKLPAMQHAASKANFREFIIINLVSMLAWPVLNAILILCATTLYKHISFIRFLGHPFWHSFNKLGLCIYLIHWEVLSYGLTSYEHGPSNGYVIDAVKLWTHSAVFTILFSFAVHLLVEAPLAELLMILGNHFIPKASEQQASKQALKSENKHSVQLV